MGSTRTAEDVKPQRGIGDNGPPLQKPFNKRRWAETLFATPNKPTGAVAMSFLLFMRMDAKGEGAAISDAEFMLRCGVSDKACRNFKGWLLKHGFLKIKVRGYRGYTSQYTALIPECNTGIDDDEYRYPIPVQMPIPEPASANPKESFPQTPFKENTTPSLQPPQQDAASGGGDYLDDLNGSAVDLIEFIGKYAVVDQQTARRMLASNIRIFSADAVLEAYAKTVAEMATSLIVKPYKYLIETAGKIKEARQKKRAAEPTETTEEKLRRIANEMDEREKPRWTQ